MNHKREKETVLKLMSLAGITINGDMPYDIQVRNDQFYHRVFHQTLLGLGESYMDRWWECKAIDRLVEKLLFADLLNKIKSDWATTWNIFKTNVFNLQNTWRAFFLVKNIMTSVMIFI